MGNNLISELPGAFWRFRLAKGRSFVTEERVPAEFGCLIDQINQQCATHPNKDHRSQAQRIATVRYSSIHVSVHVWTRVQPERIFADPTPEFWSSQDSVETLPAHLMSRFELLGA